MLKSLELFGFKSFADRTLFEFSPGVTCVVGPNGSGKSNVVDAIKWILGDQSAKSLRGKEMSDVIFNGSAGRRSSGFAEATLTFDNSEGLLPVDAAEVQIGRRLYQSGDSEYLLNRAVVRLKDIRDVFMGTGAGTAAYSIIEQGRVDQILQANPTTRRLVFEEAAGISKFQSRRVDAERRLERVAQNLARLTDIVDQVESQLNATRSQASKAAKYRELSAELKEWWTGLAADDSRLITTELQRLLDNQERMRIEEVERQSQLAEQEAHKEACEQRLSVLESEVARRESAISALREKIAGCESTIRHQQSRDGEIQLDVKRLRQQRQQLGQQARFARTELQETLRRMQSFEANFQLSQQEVQQRQTQLSELEAIVPEHRAGIQKQRSQLQEIQQQRRQLGTRRVTLETQSETLLQNREQALERLEGLQTTVQSASQELETRREAFDAAEQALQSRQADLVRSQNLHADLFQHHAETERQLRERREARSAAQARLSLLEELEQRQEGISLSVQDILQRAERAHYPPWNQILGSVRDLLEVPLDLAPLIDSALGERAQLIAVKRLTPLLDYLNKGQTSFDGRVGFVAIQPDEADDAKSLESGENGSQESQQTIDLTGAPGVYGRADRLVVESESAQGLAARVLQDTWIVETLDAARSLMAQAAPTDRFVTLQGEVLSADRRLFVGILPHEASIVSRKSELRQLKNDIHQLNRHIEAATERLTILSGRIESESGAMDAIGQELKQLSIRLTECSGRLAGQEQELARLNQEMKQQRTALEKLDQQIAQMTSQMGDLTEQMQSLDQEAGEREASLASDERELTEVEQLLQQTNTGIKSEQLELAKQEERLRGVKETQQRLERDQRQREHQLADAAQRLQEVLLAGRRCRLETLNAEAGIATCMLQLENLQREAAVYLAERQELRQQRATLVKTEEALHRERRKLADQQHALEFETQKQQLHLSTLKERIQDEFQQSLDHFVETGASAYDLLMHERYGDDDQPLGDEAAFAAEAELSEVAEVAAEDAASEETVHSQDAGRPTFAEVREELEARVDRLRRKVKTLGSVNTDALDSLEELETRYEGLSRQLQDLQDAKTALEDIIRRINTESRRIFLETFEVIRGHFQGLFRQLFGGGDADIILEDPQDVLECGIDIVARPPGKELRSISLLSGGEKTMTAVGLLFAMFKSKPSPYCILDEVDAALDDANVDRYVAVVKEFVQMTQFVIITHRKPTMTAANVLYGVTMEQAGVSKRISVRFEDVRDNGEIRTAA